MRQSQAGGIAANLHRKRLKSAVFDIAPTNSLRRAMIGSADYIEIRAIDILEGVNIIRITDKAFHYTPSYNTDLGKKFRKLEQERGAAAASSKVSEAAMFNSVLPMVARRSMSKTRRIHALPKAGRGESDFGGLHLADVSELPSVSARPDSANTAAFEITICICLRRTVADNVLM